MAESRGPRLNRRGVRACIKFRTWLIAALKDGCPRWLRSLWTNILATTIKFLSWLWQRIRNLAAKPLRSLFLALVAIIFVQLARETFRSRVVMNPIAVPQAFENAGYSPQTVANQTIDQIDEIERHAQTARKDTFALPDSDSMPDIEVPATKLSFKGVVQLL